MDPRPWQLFRAHGILWQATGAPQNFGGQIGRAVRVGIITGWTRIPARPLQPILEEPEWVRCAEIEEVLDERAEREHLAQLQR